MSTASVQGSAKNCAGCARSIIAHSAMIVLECNRPHPRFTNVWLQQTVKPDFYCVQYTPKPQETIYDEE